MTIALPLLLGALSIAAYFLLTSRRSPELDADADADADALTSVLIPAYTSHSRSLPKQSKHAFSYPLLYLGVDVDALESGALNLPGRIVRYGGQPITKLLGLRSDGYLDPGPEGLGLRAKVERLLDTRGIPRNSIGRIWLVTMPSCFGFEGINPLSTWFVYDKERRFLCVILEVHNTFGEKHAYVLQTSSSYREAPREGYDYSWTFPRSFHVSPFNSRDGYYHLDLIDPFHSGPSASPQIKIFLRQLTPSKAPKLQAVLASHPSRSAIPLTPAHSLSILITILRWPLAFFLTTPRILYHAYLLHYEKKLAVYPRPEPRTSGVENQWNPPEQDGEGVGAAVGRKSESWGERTSRRLIEAWMTQRAAQLGTSVEVIFRDQRSGLRIGGKTSSNESLVITTADPKFYTHLLGAPSSDHFLVLAKETLTNIPSPEAFSNFFSPVSQPSLSNDARSIPARAAASLRSIHLRFLWSHSRIAPTPDLALPPNKHFMESLPDETRSLWTDTLVFAIVVHVFLSDVAEERVMRMFGARFLDGQEPWRVWERALRITYMDERKSVEQGDLGSVLW